MMGWTRPQPAAAGAWRPKPATADLRAVARRTAEEPADPSSAVAALVPLSWRSPAGVVSSCLSHTCDWLDVEDRKMHDVDVVVVGAGLAGLSAARKLVRAGQ